MFISKYLNSLLVITLLLFPVVLSAQYVTGTVYGKNGESFTPLPGANVFWLSTTKGVATDNSGNFTLNVDKLINKLIVSFTGHITDTITITASNKENLNIYLQPDNQLTAVEIVNRQVGSMTSRKAVALTTNISGAQLKKAACCNLGESFETNASVDVHYADAVTGAKQIQMLGLSGVYVQMMTEAIPNLYGLAEPYGLGYIPGSWMESISISKGTSSVMDGYSSLTGQINTNTKPPDTKEKFYFNALMNSMMKMEANTNINFLINDNLSTIILAHVENNSTKYDNNGDGFMDMPLITQYNFQNKWKYFSQNDFMCQFGVKVISETRKGGQMDFEKSRDYGTTNAYGIEIETTRLEGFFKMGYEFNARSNLALKATSSYHQQNSFYGLNVYDATETSAYANLIFQSDLGNEHHAYSLGASFFYDDYDEKLGKVDNPTQDTSFLKQEIVPGAYAQYTFSKEHFPTIIAGVRADYHNEYGAFFTPRLHIRYKFNENNVLRLSAGKGFRTANVFAENAYLLASSRKIEFIDPSLKMEEAWNYGVNYTLYIPVNDREITINAEVYHSDFINQIIVDADEDAHQVYIYNLRGKSYSNVFQIEGNYELFKGFDLVLAFRYQDVKTSYLSGQLETKPMVNRYKGLINFSYATNLNKWQFDFTAQINGDQRLPTPPSTTSPDYSWDDKAPAYTLMSAQVTRFFRKWNVYIGCENLTGYTQDNPIIAANDPFGDNFDASMVWGPLTKQKVYIGVRYTINHKIN